jgi:phage major head subunit gpT-like protein
MAVDVSAFSALAKAEFQNQLMAVYAKPYPAEISQLVDEYPSTTAVETYPYMTNIPRLRVFKRDSPAVQLAADKWTVANVTYRCGPVVVQKETLDDDQVGGYLRAISALPMGAQKDIKYKILATLAGGATNTCFDGTAMFASSHTIGTGNNLMTADNASNDGITHKIIAVVNDGPAKPVLFQNRESLKDLMDNYTPQALKAREFEYWADTRFGVACAAWFTSVLMTITDTPTLPELTTIVLSMFNRLRTFTLPKGSDTDDALYFWEGFTPSSESVTLLCNLQLATLLETIRDSALIASGTGGGVVTNYLFNKFKVIPTSALGA